MSIATLEQQAHLPPAQESHPCPQLTCFQASYLGPQSLMIPTPAPRRNVYTVQFGLIGANGARCLRDSLSCSGNIHVPAVQV